MAPGRRRGAKGLKTTNELSLGDLVLAKVKGFPAWPAKISRPEDWERAPDPKKYFVQFYGTSEIAFVAPVDIQEFTLEAKNKLAARCKGKTVKYFAQAVKEISEEFEKLQQKNLNCLEDETSENAGPEEPSADVVVDDDAMEVDLKDGDGTDGLRRDFSVKDVDDHGSTLERCSQRQEVKGREDVKLCISSDKNANLSPGTYAKKRSELKTGGACTDGPLGESTCDKKVKIDVALSEQPRKVHIEACSVGGSSPIMLSNHVKIADSEHKELTNGRKSKLLTGSKKKSEGQSQVHNVVGLVQLPSSRDNSIRGVKPSVSGAQAVDGMRNKIALDFSKQSSSDMDDYSGKTTKKVLKDKHYFETVDNHMDIKPNSGEQDQSRKKKNVQHGREKQTFRHNEVSPPAKMSKCSEMSDDATKLPLQMSKRIALKSHDGQVACEEIKRSAPRGKMENRSTAGDQAGTVCSSFLRDEDVLPPTKRRRRAVEAMSNSTLTPEDQVRKASTTIKNDLSSSDSRRSSAPAPAKRRAVRLCDDDDEEATKTPVHGGYANKVVTAGQVLIESKKTDAPRKPFASGETIMKKTGILESVSLKELAPATERASEDASPNCQQDAEKKLREIKDTIVCSPCSLFSENASTKEGSPLRSPASIRATKAMPEAQRANKDSTKVSSSNDVKKTLADRDNGVGGADSFSSSLNKPANAKTMGGSSVERKKNTPKPISRFEEDSVPHLGSMFGVNSSPSERQEAGREDQISAPVDIKISDPAISMKNLIAAAQAKRRQAHLQNSHANPISFMALNVAATMGSHSPASPVQLLCSSNNLRPEESGFQSHSSLASPSCDVRQPSTTYQHENEHFEEKRLTSGNLGTGGSLSGDTEAAVARDAFEGMIETLSRTKESIGRATRLAIDCAKYGIANEVIELLIRKLESEPSFHRKVDLFFLVDSITQCSNNHKGVAGASYIPIVQAALPRLLGAAAPHGAAAHENRRQCLKVLRLWLERKILPESLLRPHMDEIRTANDDTSSGLSFRRPTRSERAIDDPIREMEGMLVDEYGSNATFQLPGLFSAHGFEDDDEEEEEEENPISTSKEVVERSPAEHTPGSRDPENCTATPNERRHCVLEDVDGELEMEDVSGHLKEERQSYVEAVSEVGPSYLGSEKNLESAPNNPNDIIELPPFPEGSPPLPPGSAPQTPPLPSSPPPTPPPPPPPSSPSPPPPPPPPPVSLSHPFPPPPMGPPPAVFPQQLLPPQTSIGPQCLPPLPPSIPPPSPVVYQKTLVHQEMGMASGKQPAQMVSSAVHGLHGDVSSRSDIYPQKSPCFVPVGVGNARESSGYAPSKPSEYGNDAYVNAQVPQPNHQFQVVNAPYVQRPLHPNGLVQNPSNHFSYAKPPVQQHPQHPYRPPYSLPTRPEPPRQYITDEQWRARPVELQNDYNQNSWIGAGSSYSGPPFVQEGNFRPPPERPPNNMFGFQTTPSGPSSGASAPSHGMSGRTEMPSLSWRPV